ncbi:MAG: S1 RNA-binding domain-containing protein [Candidatus Aenigmarchaeota archaeon]|nr:S1 RNA-binding domain-containing protein [Candidatus Aenigmarchaeota archaeon]
MAKKNGIPRWNELVLCTVTRVTPFAAWCNLDEWETPEGKPVEGMIHISEVAGKWVKDIRKFVKPDKQYIARVVRIDREKGFINLSIKRVSKFDQREKTETDRKNKRITGMLMQIAKRVSKDKVEKDAEDAIIPKLAALDRFDDAYEALEETADEPAIADEAGIEQPWKDAMMEVLRRNFQEKEVELKVTLELSSQQPDGIKQIVKALVDFEKASGATVKYISAPKYMADIRTKTPKDGKKKLEEAAAFTVKEMEKAGGSGSYELEK